MSALTPHYVDESLTLYQGDALGVLRELDDSSADCVCTSPPYYGLRDYGQPGQYGLEDSPAAYVETMRAVFAEARRVLAGDGTLWLNLGDSYSAKRSYQVDQTKGQRSAISSPYDTLADRPAKNLLGIPWRVAFALQDDGWILRNALVWHKPNAMPESVTDRLACDYEHVFMFSKSPRYHFDLDAIREPLAYPEALDGTRVFGGANKGRQGGVGSTERTRGHNAYGVGKKPSRPPGVPVQAIEHGGAHDSVHPKGRNPGSVWDIPTSPFPEAHSAVMPVRLAERCIAAGCKPGGVVLDPFSGSGTTGLAAAKLSRRYVGIDLSGEYLDLSLRTRLRQTGLLPESEAL